MGPSPLKYFCNIYKRDTWGYQGWDSIWGYLGHRLYIAVLRSHHSRCTEFNCIGCVYKSCLYMLVTCSMVHVTSVTILYKVHIYKMETTRTVMGYLLQFPSAVSCIWFTFWLSLASWLFHGSDDTLFKNFLDLFNFLHMCAWKAFVIMSNMALFDIFICVYLRCHDCHDYCPFFRFFC